MEGMGGVQGPAAHPPANEPRGKRRDGRRWPRGHPERGAVDGGQGHLWCCGQERAAGQSHLDGAPRAQVEQVQQVGTPGHQPRVDRDIGRGTAEYRGRHQAGPADAAELDRPRGDLSLSQGAEMTTETAPVAAVKP